MKLWVDDIRNAPDDTWHVARSITEAIRAIERYDFEIISLDHDISHQVQVGSTERPFPCEETFASVAYYLSAVYFPFEGRTPEPRVILHTANQIAGDEMEKILKTTHLSVEKRYMGVANRLEMELN